MYAMGAQTFVPHGTHIIGFYGLLCSIMYAMGAQTFVPHGTHINFAA